jgi:CHASE2 domain-containing sensor protein
MGLRSYIGAVIGFVVGFLISQWFVKGAPPSDVLLSMQTICAMTGAVGGLAAGTASRSGNQGKAMIAAGAGLVGCLLVGLAIMIYRWLFL